MSEQLPETTQQPTSNQNMKNIIAALIIMVLFAGIVGFVKYRRAKIAEREREATQAQIPFGQNVPPADVLSGTTDTQSTDIQNDAQTPAESNNPPAVPATTEYRNEQFGIVFTLPGPEWQVSRTDTRKVVVSRGQDEGIIEVYENSNEALDSIEQQLKKSRSVSKVTRTTIDNQPALEYVNKRIKGIAVIFNNRLYYISAVVTDPVLLNTFHSITPNIDPRG